MSCPETENTLLWLYGESEGHLDHLATCADCQALVAEHEQVLAVLPVTPVTPARRTSWALAGLALAASVAMALLLQRPAPYTPIESTPNVQAAVDLDDDIDALDEALWRLEDDLATL